jgi:antitoxin component of RelBE/YafQ-DinJ toxin-antitoxin module
MFVLAGIGHGDGVANQAAIAMPMYNVIGITPSSLVIVRKLSLSKVIQQECLPIRLSILDQGANQEDRSDKQCNLESVERQVHMLVT